MRTINRAPATLGSEAWLGESAMAARVREFDWRHTPLGPIATWPRSLRSAVAICLHSRFQMAIYWGPELTCLYNDAARDALTYLHPRALGMPARELLRDSWDVVGPQLQTVIDPSEATRAEDRPLTFERSAQAAESDFTYSLSPILDDASHVGGVLLVAVDAPRARPLVVVAEPNAGMREYLRRVLSPEFSVTLAGDGRQALKLAVAMRPSIVVTDVTSPALDGFALMRELRRDPRTRSVPVILLSARADPDSTLRALELGAEDYIIKPFGGRELLARVRATLENSRVRIDSAIARGRSEERTRHEGELRVLLNDLRAAQRRVAAAGDAERRRIERDLHDGAQQRLMAIRLELGMAREILDRDPATAGARLEALHRELDEALEELRELAHGLHPALLASDGLSAALESAARHCAIPVTVEATDVGRAPRPIESAAYFCCLEALQNAAKHAGPRARAAIRVRMTDGLVEFRVADNGEGFDPATVRPGYGIVNVRDRVEALGGHVEVTSAPGRGTTVVGRMPLS